ncbi:pali-domain-containing protein [Suillus fuscotomentosus]|uniref:Pali-domain-containing protein n=1 Tax=Suillus fuscotomentosus TaxID=1912939 RepID=A0AAD4HU30_9AGAM|nr:pali-domain-containing protein [Suillus fuscotomentosus]KAG1908336.1 pali-domain-containing protein [Suillus fuscotomentosus]
MSFIRPATPGFLITLIATILLGVVSFSVPLIKSIYFLKASLAVEGTNGYITFGTLGYCSDISGTVSCSSATVGYELNINALVGDNTALQIPTVVVKWLTYALVLHIVAFGLAGVAAVFGLLAHIREMAMTCFSSCISGFAATVALTAFIFDLVIFFVAKSRMNSVSGGSASIGNAVWITLVAWVLLFFSGCFYGVGRCCIRRRPRDNDRMGRNGYADQMRLDAVKAEVDRKARQQRGEIGLPPFQEYDPSQPLKARISGDGVFLDEEDGVLYRDNQSVSTAGRAGMGSYGRRPSANGYAGGGYVQAPLGTRAVDEYNNTSPHAAPPLRKSSTLTQTTSSSTYPPTSTTHSMSPLNSYAVPGAAITAPVQNASGAYYSDPYSPQAYGHVEGSSSRTPPQQHVVYNPWEPQQTQPDSYNVSGVTAAASYVNAYNQPPHQPEQNYAASTTGAPQLPDPYYPSNYRSPTPKPSSPPLANTSGVKGPRGPPSPVVMSPPSQMYNDNPPTYEDGPSRTPVQWKS